MEIGGGLPFFPFRPGKPRAAHHGIINALIPDWRLAMQPEKRVRIMLPLRLQRASEPPPRKKVAVCTYDVSEHGVRITGLQEPLQVGETVFLERGRNRAKYTVVWVGKAGTPLGGQAGMCLLSEQESIWDIDLGELQEEYEPVIPDENLIPNYREAMFNSKQAKARIVGSSFQADGNLVQLSERECTILTDGDPPVNSSVTLFVSGEGFDLRFRGTVRAYASKYLIVDLKDLRRGDRRLFDYLFTLADKV